MSCPSFGGDPDEARRLSEQLDAERAAEQAVEQATERVTDAGLALAEPVAAATA